MTNIIEIFKDVVGQEGRYQVSNLGRVKSLIKKGGKIIILKPSLNKRGYYYIGLCRGVNGKRITIHRLVCLTFVPNPENKPQVNHKNHIKTDNRVSNLEWVTNRENVTHYFNSKNKKFPTCIRKFSNKFKVQAWLNGKRRYLGMYSTIDEAKQAYLKAINSSI